MVVSKVFDDFAFDCPADDVRLQEICSAARPFCDKSERFMPTSIVLKEPVVKGMRRVDLSNLKLKRQAALLCKKRNLKFPSQKMLQTSLQYAKYIGKKMVSLLCFTQMKLNRTPGSLAISVDIAASIDTEHSMSIAIESLKKMLYKRRNPCVLFTQVANTANSFWQVKP